MNARSVRNNGVLHALTRIRRLAGAFTMAAALALAFSVSPTSVYAQSTAGAIYGKVAAGSTVTVENMETGAKRSTTASGDGSYRIGALPAGNYKVTFADGTTRDTAVAVGSSTLVSTGSEVLELEKFVVGGLAVNPIDFTNTESVTVLNEKQIDLLPIPRTVAAVALLAPGTTQGDSAFGDLVSFAGASVAENAYFINGFNVSNFRNGLDPAKIPFEFYNQFEVKTGAYSAEFGRSTGGVINATTKSGSNEFHAGLNVYFSPDALRSNNPSTYNGTTPYVYNDQDYSQNYHANFYVSGPLWKNRLFFYGLYELQDDKREDVVLSGTTHRKTYSDDPFWGAKLDFIPFDGHRIEYTTFRDEERETTEDQDFDFASKTISGDSRYTYSDRGGDTHIVRYSGSFGDNLTVSAMWGKSEQNRTEQGSEDAKTLILDARTPGIVTTIQGNDSGLVTTASDEREAMRLDFEYAFTLWGSHRLRAGLDREDNFSAHKAAWSGDLYWRYLRAPASGIVNGVNVGAGTEVVRERIIRQGGSFTTKSNAWYVEDNWTTMNDRLVLRLGLRNETFENLNASGDPFIEVKDQMAPRLGASYDLFGNQKTKVFANFGRYHLPVAANTNVRLAGGELFTDEYFYISSLSADGTNLTKGAKIGNTVVSGDGSVHDRREIVDLDIKPMYQDEVVVGFQHALNKQWKVGMRGTARFLNGTAMDDMIVDHALTAWAQDNGFGGYDALGAHAYVLANPGRDIRMFWDFNENGTLEANEEAILTAEMLGYPSANRQTYSVEVFAEKVWDGKWNAQFSYTWSHTYGNYEGWVLSDIGQDDAGITQMFDSPALTNNTKGNSPNDRRHSFKAFGAYQLTSEIAVGVNLLLESGRPINKVGIDPTDDIAGYSSGYLVVPRGSAGTTDWVFSTDLSMRYTPKWIPDNKVSFSVDVINVFNGHRVKEVSETYHDAVGNVLPTWGLANGWQTPRYVRFSASYDF